MNDAIKVLRERLESQSRIDVPEQVKKWLSEPRRLFIGGRWKEGNKSATFPTLNPATGETLSQICCAEREDVELAVSSARSAFERGAWSRMPLKERAVVVRRIGDLILEHRPVLALLETLDSGKPIRESYEGDIFRAAQNFQFFAEFATHEEAPFFPNPEDVHFAFREPLGVVALITPWNLPLYLETWKVAPALMMGNSIVLKPSELTPLTACYLAELIEKSGLPEGVFNLVQGFGENSTGEFLTSSRSIDAISFTGETSTGRAIMKSAAAGPTRVSFELGGKGATVVFDDANLEQAVSEAARAAFRNQGEICLACPRIFVQRNVYDAFLDGFVKKAREVVLGDPLDYATTMGALISADHWEKVSGYLSRVKAPSRILTGGSRPKELSGGNFMAPTVVVDVGLDHPISREEVFGPVVSIYPFTDEKEVCRAVNDTPYGLSASIWTTNLARAHRVAREIQIGLVWINCWFVRDLRVPFGGQKRSGLGREGGTHSLDFFSEWKSVCVKMEPSI